MAGAFQNDAFQNDAFQTAIEVIQKAIGGTLSFVGSLAKSISKNISGALIPSAILSKSTGKLTSGVLSFVGALSKLSYKTLAGVITPAGSLVKSTSKAISGGLNFAGSLIKTISKTLGGAVTFTGTLIAKLVQVGRRLKMWLFNRPYYDAAVDTKPYRNMTSETREVKP